MRVGKTLNLLKINNLNKETNNQGRKLLYRLQQYKK